MAPSFSWHKFRSPSPNSLTLSSISKPANAHCLCPFFSRVWVPGIHTLSSSQNSMEMLNQDLLSGYMNFPQGPGHTSSTLAP